jgi:hypothetical protein
MLSAPHIFSPEQKMTKRFHHKLYSIRYTFNTVPILLLQTTFGTYGTVSYIVSNHEDRPGQVRVYLLV